MFSDLNEVQFFIEKEQIQQIDLKFCDIWGRWHHSSSVISGADGIT